MTLAELDAAIAELEAAKRARLTGVMVSKVSYDSRVATEFAAATVAEIEQELTRLRVERARLTGCPSPVRPVYAGFGSR
ncbi:hypothetical protein [Hansschlegelia zhihuaiae]|uniref:Uncharacterized protein n=1 Tax=Hansschlegelia zhihuaiae TaxID=405005 RepID=A0A4V1KIW5_9HYPH|nr:hypothetical protein [Hansschlegelia zhihuaiae]RXF72112.1 hypothetical protein EK403_14985 [Hansschlegelia zhihuaiae]